MVNGKRTADAAVADKAADSDAVHVSKRSRVSRACDQCRSNRERCDGAKPCQTCITQSRGCSYEATPKKRGIQPNYIRTLEVTLAWLFHTYPQAELGLTSSLTHDDGDAGKAIGWKESKTAEALHQAWRKSPLPKQLDQLLSGEPVTTEGEYIGGSTTMNDVNNTGLALSPPSRTTSLDLHPPSRAAANLDEILTSNPGPRLSAPGTAPVLVKLPENAWELLEYYFAFTNAWLPVTEKHIQLKLMYTYPREGLTGDQIRAPEHAELWSILALASSQTSSDPERSRWIRDTAESLIPTVGKDTAYEIPHIRALLVMVLLDMSEQRTLAAWLRIGSVVSLLLLFRLINKLGQTTKWCRHLQLAAFVLESALACHLRVPTHLRHSYVNQVGFVEEDGLEEWSPWYDPMTYAPESGLKPPIRALSTLNALVRIALTSLANNDTDLTGAAAAESSAGSGIMVVFSLLENAASKHTRVQPCLLLGQTGYQGVLSTTAMQSHDQSDLVRPTADQISTMLSGMTPTPLQPLGIADFQSPQLRTHSPAGGHIESVHDAALLAYPHAATSQAGFDGSTFGSFPTPVNVFEEFDDILEHEDAGQQSQFYKNLGFAPDVVLAEFFGEDYQPTDPLLAYLNPSLYGMEQRLAGGTSWPDAIGRG